MVLRPLVANKTASYGSHFRDKASWNGLGESGDKGKVTTKSFIVRITPCPPKCDTNLACGSFLEKSLQWRERKYIYGPQTESHSCRKFCERMEEVGDFPDLINK